MKVGLKWLQEFVPVDVPVEKLVDLLDLSGTKVESVTKLGGDVHGVVVAKVLDIQEHPNADNLTLVEVEVGGQTTERVVCGARNFAVGDRVPLATVGSRLPGLEVGERKIRGEISRGMLCSASELGVSKDHSGILVLPNDSQLGQDVVSLLGLDDTLIELEITPNRPDCLSMIGVAREVAALLRNPLTIPEARISYDESLASPVRVDVQDPEGCPRYLAMYIADIGVRSSPSWMVARLLGAGIRSISNVVDATNYILLETGQPLHAFDAARVHDHRIIVRRARAGEKLETLDGVTRDLHPEDLMIADPRGALGIAGVMGGATSEVSSETTNVILESAHFDPDSIARTSRRHILRSEASARFEKGSDPEIVQYAAARAAALIADLTGGTVSEKVVDEYPEPIRRRHLTLRPQRTDRVLGFSLPAEEQAHHLRSIGLDVTEADAGPLEVEIPTFRPDLFREIDLVEEVARLAGFDRLPSTVPPGHVGKLERVQVAERTLRRALVVEGVAEAWTSSFFSPRDLDRLGLPPDHPARNLVALDNPMSQEETSLRSTLMPGVLRAVSRNSTRRIGSVALFEVARIYEPSGEDMPQEGLVLGAAFTGARVPQSWRGTERHWDFFEAKGVLIAALQALGVGPPAFSPRSGAPFHPTRAAEVSLGDRTIGVLGELHPDVCQNFEVPERTVAFEVALAPIFAALPVRPQVEDLPRFPPILIDIAVVMDRDVPAQRVLEVVENAGRPEVGDVRLFDLYEGEQVEAGKKSLAFALQLRDPDRTLTDEDAAKVRSRIVEALSDSVGATLRA